MTRLGRKPLFFDGAMGTILQEKGLAAGEAPELWNLLHPKDVLSVHISYLEAGVDIISANTFGANPLKCQENGVEPEEVIAAGVRLAHQAVEQAGHGVVALDIGPSGKLLFPMGDLAFEEAVNAFAQMASAGADAGPVF